jgi:hypothetical protein
MPYRVAPCAEFPNDNPSLHEGAIWLCAEIGADASCELRAPEEGVALVEVVEVVEDLAFDDAFEEQVAVPSDEDRAPEELGGSEGREAEPEQVPDAFETFVGVLADVATDSGADAGTVACLCALLGQSRLEGIVPDERVTEALVAGALVVRTDRGLMRAPGFTSVVVAWKGILRGESEDFEPCGAATLDEWSANLVARVLGLASRSEGIRRALRLRGVAAFGFVANAA